MRVIGHQFDPVGAAADPGDPEVDASPVGAPPVVAPSVVVDSVVFDVERGKIREFASATFAADPVHTDAVAAWDAGFADLPATATHVVVAGHFRDQQGFVAALRLDITRIVVGSVEWIYRRPLLAGDSLTGVRTVVSDETRTTSKGGSLRFVTLRTDYRVDDGETPVVVTEVLIERGRP